MRTLKLQILATVLLMLLAVIVQAFTGNQTGRHTYVVRYKHGDSLIPVTVVLDYKRQTEYVINMNSRTPAKSMTLYDFKERVIVYKDLKNGECFIGRLTDETIQDEDAVLKRLQNPVESQPLILTLERDRPSLTPTEVRNMAGHKTAVFCRRMNTWTLLPPKENRRKRRDTLSHLDRSPAHHDQHLKSKHISHQRDDVIKTEQANTQSSKSNRDFPTFQSNGSFSLTRSTTEHHESASSSPTTVLDAFKRLNNVYPPFILPQQKSLVEENEERRRPRQYFSIYNATRKTVDDGTQRFDSVHERPNSQDFPEFSQSRLSGSVNETSLISSPKRPFIPLETNRPVIIPSISFPSKYQESKLPGNHNNNNQVNSPRTFPVGYPQNTNDFHTLYNRGDTVGRYPSFHQLPPEAFILPLTRSFTATTTPYVFNNRLGYEIVHPDSSSSYNHTGLESTLSKSLNQSEDTFNTGTSEHNMLHSRSSSTDALDNHQVSASIPGAPLHPHNHSRSIKTDASTSLEEDLSHETERSSSLDSYTDRVRLEPPDRLSNETGKTYRETSTSSSSALDSFIGHSDTPIQIPRWYPEITKQISIPLQIEVLHHQEEYLHGISNGTDQVHTIRGHEIEDHSSPPIENTIFPLPVEVHSNGARFSNEVKLLPQISVGGDDSSKNTLNQTLGRRDEKVDRTFEPAEFRGNSYPLYREESNISQQETFLTDTSLVNGTLRSFSTDSVPGVRRRLVNQISHPTPSFKGTVEDSRRTPKIQHQIKDGSFAVHDFKIDEGVPTYRKRFPSVTQLFPPEETVAADVGKLPDRQFHQQSQNTRRRPSAVRNKTHRIPPRRQGSNSVWRKHSVESRNFVTRQQQPTFNDQGITFHHRGYGKPVNPYDHHQKRLGMLPPGVSVHPRHPQAPYADLATDTADKTVPVNPLLQSRPRRIHLRHHRRHQRKRNRILSSPDSGPSSANCCGGDGLNCCSGRRRGRHFPKSGCCSQPQDSHRPNSVPLHQTEKTKVPSKKKVEDVAEDRCMKEKMCRTVYQSTKKVLVCRNVAVEGC